MSWQPPFLGALLAAVIVLLVSERVRLDVVALGLIVVLAVSGILTPAEAVAGFGDTVVLLIAALFVIGDSLQATGVARAVGDWIRRRAGGGERRLMVLVAGAAAALSAFMSSTGAVAVFIPIVFRLADRSGVAPSRLLLPLAYGALAGGTLTLIGTPPNLVVSTQLEQSGYAPFGFFSFTPAGLAVLSVTLLYLVVYGQKRLPDRRTGAPVEGETTIERLSREFGVRDRVRVLRVGHGSPLAGLTLGGAELRSRTGHYVLAIERRDRLGRRYAVPGRPGTILREGDALLALADEGSHRASGPEPTLSTAELGLRVSGEDDLDRVILQELGVVPAAVLPDSSLIGRTLAESAFRERYGLWVLAVRRGDELLRDDLADTKLAFGDRLLLGGRWAQIDRIRQEMGDLALLRLPREHADAAPSYRKAWLAVGLVVLMLSTMTLGLLPAVIAVLLTAVLMVLGGCLDMRRAYAAINWESIVLIAGMLPMAHALEKTGTLALIVDELVGAAGPLGPRAFMAGLFVLTAFFSQFISNTATTVLVAPIAVGAAGALGVSPRPLLMIVAIAASAAFVTPVASPVNTLVLGPGGYRFRDFVKLGLPLIVLTLVTSLVVVPWLYPLEGG